MMGFVGGRFYYMYSRYSEPNQQVNKKKMKSYQHNSVYEFLFIIFTMFLYQKCQK